MHLNAPLSFVLCWLLCCEAHTQCFGTEPWARGFMANVVWTVPLRPCPPARACPFLPWAHGWSVGLYRPGKVMQSRGYLPKVEAYGFSRQPIHCLHREPILTNWRLTREISCWWSLSVNQRTTYTTVYWGTKENPPFWKIIWETSTWQRRHIWNFIHKSWNQHFVTQDCCQTVFPEDLFSFFSQRKRTIHYRVS